MGYWRHYHTEYYREWDIHYFPEPGQYAIQDQPGEIADDETGENTSYSDWARWASTPETLKGIIDNWLKDPLEVYDIPGVSWETHVDPGWTVMQEPAGAKRYYAVEQDTGDVVTPYYPSDNLQGLQNWVDSNLIPTGVVMQFTVSQTGSTYDIHFTTDFYTYWAKVSGTKKTFSGWDLPGCKDWIVEMDTGEPPVPPEEEKEPKADLVLQEFPSKASAMNYEDFRARVDNVGDAEGDIAIVFDVLSSSPSGIFLSFRGREYEVPIDKYYWLEDTVPVGGSLQINQWKPKVVFPEKGTYAVRIYGGHKRPDGSRAYDEYETKNIEVSAHKEELPFGDVVIGDIPLTLKAGSYGDWHIKVENTGGIGDFGFGIANLSVTDVTVKHLGEETLLKNGEYYRAFLEGKSPGTIIDSYGRIKFAEAGNHTVSIWGMHRENGVWAVDEKHHRTLEITKGKKEEEEEKAGEYDNKGDCEDAGYYWYDGACHAEKPEEEKTLWDKVTDWWDARTEMERIFVVGTVGLTTAVGVAKATKGRGGVTIIERKE